MRGTEISLATLAQPKAPVLRTNTRNSKIKDKICTPIDSLWKKAISSRADWSAKTWSTPLYRWHTHTRHPTHRHHLNSSYPKKFIDSSMIWFSSYFLFLFRDISPQFSGSQNPLRNSNWRHHRLALCFVELLSGGRSVGRSMRPS